MFRIELSGDNDNGNSKALMQLILVGYAILIFTVIVFVIVSTVREIVHF